MTIDHTLIALGVFAVGTYDCQSPIPAMFLQNSLEHPAGEGADAAGSGFQAHTKKVEPVVNQEARWILTLLSGSFLSVAQLFPIS